VAQSKSNSIKKTREGFNLSSAPVGGFGVPVANVLFAPSTPAFALPAHPCAALFINAGALPLLQSRFVSNPPLPTFVLTVALTAYK